MNKLIPLLLIALACAQSSARAQLLLSTGQSYTYEFSSLLDFGDGYASPNPRGFATFYTDPAKSTPGALYRIELFENNTGESAIATVNGTGNLTAIAVNAWQDFSGAARATVTSGDVFFNALTVNVYTPGEFGDYALHSSGLVPVPEPGTLALMALGAAGLLSWCFKRQRG